MTETAQANPLADGLSLRRTPDPCVLVIFGASGDLAHKKIMPALYALAVRRLLPERFATQRQIDNANMHRQRWITIR